MTLQGQQVHPPPSMPPPTEHTEQSGANSPSVFTSKYVSVKAGKETYIPRILGGGYCCCAQDDNVRCLLFKKALINGTSSDIMICTL